MPHLIRVRTDAEWARCVHVTGAQMAAIDANTVLGLNGDSGDSYTPSANLFIGGAGIGISGPWTLQNFGRTQTDGASTFIIFGKKTTDDAFLYDVAHAERTKDLRQAITSDSVFTSDRSTILFSSPLANISTFAAAAPPWLQANRSGARFFVAIRVHDGSTLAYVRLSFRVTVNRTGQPPPELATRIRIVRVDASGNIEALRSQDLTTDQDGFQAAAPASGSVWYNGGDTQHLDYVPTQNSVVDISKYTYLAEIIEEGIATGSVVETSLPLNQYIALTARCTNITLLACRR